MDTPERVTEIVTQAATEQEGIARALDAVLEATQTASGTVHITRPGTALMDLMAAKNIPPVVIDKIREIPIGKGMGGVAVEQRRPVTTCNLQTDDAGGIIRQGARDTGAQGAVAVPIMDGDEAVGALGVATREPRDFTREEIDDILRMGSAIARGLRSRGRT